MFIYLMLYVNIVTKAGIHNEDLFGIVSIITHSFVIKGTITDTIRWRFI